MRAPGISIPQGWAVVCSLLFVCLLGPLPSCRQSDAPIQSTLDGRITVPPSADMSHHGGFQVLVLHAQGRRIDTLGVTKTGPDGRFDMTVTAPKRGLYSLTLWGEQGTKHVATTDYVVAPDESGTLNVELPLTGDSVHVDSPENRALARYRRTMALHRQKLSGKLHPENYNPEALVQNVRLTSSVLWSLQDHYPDTYAGHRAAVESIALLEGWNDSLAVHRALQIGPSNPWYIDAVRAARKAEARLHGQQSALDLIDRFADRAETAQQRAGVMAVRIQTFLDSQQTKAARSAAQQLTSEHPRTKWAEWADRVQYEAEYLRPGTIAPTLTARTLAGDSLSLRDLRGTPVILEFYRPGNNTYTRQLPARNAVYDVTRPDSVKFVSVSVLPDTLVTASFLRHRRVPGHQIIAPGGRDDSVVKRFNVVDPPIRFLLDGEGRIIGQYHHGTLLPLRMDVVRLLSSSS